MKLFGDDPLDLRPRSDAERWFVASKPGVTFAFSVVDGVVAQVAPIGRRWMAGRRYDEALGAKLRRNGYDVSRLP